MTPELLETPLLGIHQDAGATLVPFAGWSMPVRYTTHLAEHEAVRTAVGMFDLSHMAQIFVTGTGAAEALNRCFISPMDAMKVGKAKYSMITSADGGIMDDLIVYRLADDQYLVVANASNRETVVAALQERCSSSPDVEVADRTIGRIIIAIQGPRSVEVMKAAGFDVADMKYYSVQASQFAEQDILIARTGYTGEDGFEIYGDASIAADLWTHLASAGVDYGLTLCGLACRDTLRLEAGMPLYGHELNQELCPADVGMGRMVKFDHDFVGAQALQDRPARYMLIGLQGEGRRAAREGSPIVRDGQPIGEVTSGVLSPTLGFPIAIARVELPGAEPGDVLDVDVRGRIQQMQVVKLPFYSRQK